MGQPKKQRKKYSNPQEPFDKDRIDREKALEKEFGLRRKHELRRIEAILRSFRGRARDLQAKPDEKKKKELFERLSKLGLIDKNAKLDDVLGIKADSILSRRLQTIVYKKSLTSSIKQARQLIVHGHVLIGKRKIQYPGYIVPLEQEEDINLNSKMAGKIIEKTEKAHEKIEEEIKEEAKAAVNGGNNEN